MKNRLKQEVYFPIIVFIHLLFWMIDLYYYQGEFKEVHSNTMLFGELKDVSWHNMHRILGEVFSSWVVTVFAFNFLMATRARWVERLFGGLDKMYLIHRRSGIIAVVLLLAHFIAVPRDVVFSIGKPLGFYSFILILIGVLLSALPYFKKKIPYHKWVNIHKLMGVFYVMGVIHGLTVKSLISELPITRVYVFCVAFIGIASWFYRAFLFDIFNKALTYNIEQITDKGNQITELILHPQSTSINYVAGQFAFFKLPSISQKENHPFTISSHPSDDHLRVTIKALGDYTTDLKSKLKENDTVYVEGAYGQFTQNHISNNKQIWIAGGIGITPFLSLAKDITEQEVELIWCVSTSDEAAYKSELEQVANDNKNFKFRLWASSEKGYLSADKLEISNYKDYDYLVCGPAVLKHNLFNQLTGLGVHSNQLHDEEFAFR